MVWQRCGCKNLQQPRSSWIILQRIQHFFSAIPHWRAELIYDDDGAPVSP